MASILDTGLVDVSFIDETNYITPSDTDDVVGMVVDANWGPVMRPVVCDSSRFRSLFNPNGLGRLSTSMVSAHRCFAAGASLLEVVRAPRSDERWHYFGIEAGDPIALVNKESTDSISYSAPDMASTLESPYVGGWRLRYMGAFPMAVVVKKSGRKLSGKDLYTIQVLGLSGTVSSMYKPQGVPKDSDDETLTVPASVSVVAPEFGSVLETLQVTFEPLSLNGVSYFYADVIAANSQYLFTDPAWAAGLTAAAPADTALVLGLGDFIAYKTPAETNYADSSENEQAAVKSILATRFGVPSANVNCDFTGTKGGPNSMEPTLDETADATYLSADGAVSKGFGIMDDRDLATSTILVNGFAYQDFVDASGGDAEANYKALFAVMSDVAERRKDLNALVGCPATAVFWNNKILEDGAPNATEVRNYFDEISSQGLRMFTSGMIAWERYQYSTVLGKVQVDLDGTALWAGRMAAVAYSLRNRNQVPSYKAYGRVSASLVRTLSLSDVKSLHDDVGTASVYSSVTGNYIFGIRDLYAASESYFARLNVMRVTAALLSGVYDLVEEVIHTDVAANRANRLALQARIQSFMGNMIARSELRPESVADVGDVINTDAATNGGRILRIHLVCYFMSLTEKVDITVIARDNSVTATEITQG